MKKLIFLLITLAITGGMAWGQTTINNVTFETAGGYSTSISEFTDNYYDFFIRTNGSNIGSNYSVSNIQGSYFFGAEDIDGEGATLPVTLTIDDINISGYTNLQLKVYLAEDDDGTNQDWDAADYVHFDYDIDNSGSFTELLWIESSGSTNTEPKIDTDFDGVGDGTAITNNFVQFTQNISGTGSLLDIKITFYLDSGDEDIAIDNIEIVGTASSSVDDPTNFTATTSATDQIDLSWTKNSSGNSVMVAYSTDGTFGTPSDGTSYSVGSSISGGGTVIYNGSGTSYNHTGLTSGTHYYYKAWSVDGSTNYSSGVTDDATTYKDEPSNHVTGFSASAASSSKIDLTWTENDGTVVPDGYLIIASTGTVTDPSDGTDPVDDTDLTDGSGNVKVAHGTTSYSFTNCSASTTYNFKIYPYTNSGSAIDFKVDGTVPSASATTSAGAVEPSSGDLIISEVNSTATANATYVEIYNTTSNEISLDNVDLEYYNNGASSATTTINLSGSVAANSYIIVARDAATFQSTYSKTADFENSNLYLNGGADGLVLTHDTNGDIDYFNDAPSPSVSWTDNHLFYRYDFSSDGSSLSDDWDDSGYEKNGTPKADNKLTWQTTGTSDWGTGSNWDNGDEPSKGVDVVIPSGGTQPTVDGSASTPEECMNLTINSGATLTINTAGFLSVHGTLTNNGSISISSDVSNTGSLIENTGVTVSMQRYISAWINSTRGWHFLSSPVSSQNIQPEFVPNPPTTSEDFYKFDETASSENWINSKDASGNWNSSFESTFGVGTGYLVAYQSAQTKTFSGTTNVSDVPVSGLTYTSASPYTGWHLLGNPYPCALLWNNTSWSLSNIDATAKIWDESSASYQDIITGAVIPQTQGFMVHVNNSAGGSLTIDASDRIHGTTNWYKSTEQGSKNRLLLTAVDPVGKTAQKSIIVVKEDATDTGFDTQYDSHFLAGYAPQFYSVTDGVALSLNALPSLSDETEIPFTFIKNSSTDFYITVEGIETLNPAEKVYLKDLKTGYTQLMNDNPRYEFSSQDGDDPNRFVLLFAPVGIEENIAVKPFNIYNSGSRINIVSNDKNNDGAVARIYNVAGQQVKTVTLSGTKTTVDMGNAKGIYVVSVISGSKSQNQKVVLN